MARASSLGKGKAANEMNCQLFYGPLKCRLEGCGRTRVSRVAKGAEPQKGLSELADLPLPRVPQKVTLWGFPGSCWADAMCRVKLACVVMYRQKSFHAKHWGCP